MTVTKLWHVDSESTLETADLQKEPTQDAAVRTILRIGNVANNARLNSHGTKPGSTAAASAVWASTLGDEASSVRSRWLGQPTDVAMLDLLDSFGEDDVRERIGNRRTETPFSSERKWMGVVIQGNAATDSNATSDVAYIKGAIEQVLRRCDSYLTKDARDIILDDVTRQRIVRQAHEMASEGLRVLGMARGPTAGKAAHRPSFVRNSSLRETPNSSSASSPVRSGFADEDIFHGLVFAGLVGMNDPPRPSVDRSIRRLMAGGVKVIMITGDAEATAIAIGKKLGMPISLNSAVGKTVIRGDELDNMSEEELSQAIVATNIFARTSPDHKMKIVRALQARDDIVAMTGDGVNDAPALKKADIGVAMGRLGTDVAKEAADMILTDDDFSTILNAIEEGKGIFSNIQNFLTFQLSTSAAALSLVLLSTVLGLANPLNAMQILWISECLMPDLKNTTC